MTVAQDFTGCTITFETKPCSRCGGTGQMPFSAWEGKCFRCAGAGTVLTPAGKSAHKRYEIALTELCTVNITDVTPGQSVRDCGRWVKVHRIETGEFAKGSSLVNGVMVPYTLDVRYITRMRNGEEVSNLTRSSASVIVRPAGEKWNAVVSRVAHLKGTIITRKGI